MKFSGRLQIEADPRNWVKTDLNLSQGRLELVSGGDILGSWSTAQVKAERVEGDKFQLHLGNDRLIFAADDALAFSYEALPVLAKKSVLAVAGGLRGKLRKGLATPEPSIHADVPIYVEPAAPPDAGHFLHETEPVEEAAPTRKLRDLIHAAVKSNAAGLASPGADLLGTSVVASEAAAPAHNRTEDEATDHPKPRISEGQLDREAVVPEVEARESVVDEPVSEAPDAPADVPTDPPAVDLSPRFAAGVSSKTVAARPASILPEAGARFESGETLAERHGESFRWNPDANEGKPSANQPASSPRASGSLDALVDEVRDAAMTPAQIGALANLIRALADAIEDRAPKV